VFWGNPKSQTLANPQGLNSYSYANDNPISNKDSDGREAYTYNFLSLGAEGGFGFYAGATFGAGISYIHDPETGGQWLTPSASFGAASGDLKKQYYGYPANDSPNQPFVLGLAGGGSTVGGELQLSTSTTT
jgi:hypothetical protein